MSWIKSKKYKNIFNYIDKEGDKKYAYRYRYVDETGKQKEKRKQGYETEVKAYRGLLELETLVLQGDLKQVNNDNLTVANWCDKWLEFNKKKWKVSTYAQRVNCVKYQIKPLIGNKKLATLDRITYQKLFIDALIDSNEYAISTIRLFHNIFKIAVNAAVDDEIIPKNRIIKVNLPQEEKKELSKDNYYDMDELREFFKAAENDNSLTARMAFKILATTGMRRGECQALTWNNLIEETPNYYYFSIEATRDQKGTRKPKTENSYRNVEISEDLYRKLLQYKTWCKQACLMYGIKFKESNCILISQQTATEISDTFIGSSLKRIIKNNGLKEISPHAFRHTLATIYINEGIPVPTIAKILGNTPAMITEVYAHSIKVKELAALEISRQISVI